MEERYVNMSRKSPRSSGRREASPPDGPRRRREGRSWIVSVIMWMYKAVFVLSAIIVVAYVGLTLKAKPPEQAQQPEPPSIGTSSGTSSTADLGAISGLERRKGVYNIFLAATDKGGSLTDTMMVMSYDTTAQTVGVVSIPRDTLTPRAAGENPRLVYGGGGVEQRMKDVSQMLGIPIDNYVKVDITGFIALVDYLDGVDFYIPCYMDYDDPYQNLYIHYTEGQRHLSGQQAMEVARFRKNNDGSGYSDVGRTQTQQALLVALAKKVLGWGSLTKINGFVKIFNEYVDTDLTLDNMLYFASQAVNLDTSSGVETATLSGRGDGIYNGIPYCYELDPAETLATVNRLLNPYTEEMTLENMNLGKAQGYM